jgi:hypothetical protein
VDFRDGATKLVARVAAAAAGGTIEVRLDGCQGFTAGQGTVAGTCQVMGTGGPNMFADVECAIEASGGPHDLCLVFGGTSEFKLDSLHLE